MTPDEIRKLREGWVELQRLRTEISLGRPVVWMANVQRRDLEYALLEAESALLPALLDAAEAGSTSISVAKKPVGRSAPMEMANSLCDRECDGYYADPPPPTMWPNEECDECGEKKEE